MTTIRQRTGRGGIWNVTHCPKGHEYTPENTMITAYGARACRECRRARARHRYATDPAYRQAQRENHRAWREAQR